MDFSGGHSTPRLCSSTSRQRRICACGRFSSSSATQMPPLSFLAQPRTRKPLPLLLYAMVYCFNLRRLYITREKLLLNKSFLQHSILSLHLLKEMHPKQYTPDCLIGRLRSYGQYVRSRFVIHLPSIDDFKLFKSARRTRIYSLLTMYRCQRHLLRRKRRGMREQYVGMTAEDKEAVLREKHVYKMGKGHTVPSSDQSDIPEAQGGSNIPSPRGCVIDKDSDAHGIFESVGQVTELEECLDTTKEGETCHDDDAMMNVDYSVHKVITHDYNSSL